MSGVPSNMQGRPLAEFQYTNWRGETEFRRVVPDRVVWMDEPDYGYKPGFFLIAWDIKRGALRQFSLDPERMRPVDSEGNGRQPMSPHGVNILLKVR